MKFPILGLSAAFLLMASVAHAQLPPGLNPGVNNQAAQRAQQTDVAYWYNLLPPQIFGVFGDVDRIELLQSKGAVYDRNRGFIEVFVPGDANQNDVEKLQVKLYQGNQGMMVAVSQIVWNQPNVQGALGFFALGNAGQLFDVTKQVFPYTLAAPAEGATAEGATTEGAAAKKAAPPINAYLSRTGTAIETGVPETKTAGDSYAWNGTVFGKAEANRKR